MIFPQTSHFDDLQKQKGKRLPCGVFPFGWLFVFIRKQEGFEPVRAWENTWIDKTEGLCQPLCIVETYANVLLSPNRHRSQNALHPCRGFYLSLH